MESKTWIGNITNDKIDDGRILVEWSPDSYKLIIGSESYIGMWDISSDNTIIMVKAFEKQGGQE